MAAPRHVLLIGGPPGAGKTTLGRAVAAELDWPSLTGDDLVVAVRAMTPPEERPELHPMWPDGHVRYFTEGPPQRLIDDSIAMEEAMWPALERVIRMHATVKESIVIDWWLLSPKRVAALHLTNLSSVWIHMDPNALLRREQSNIDFLAGSDQPDQMLANFMQRSLRRNELVKEQATKYGFPVIHQPGNRPVADLVQATLAISRVPSVDPQQTP